MRLTYLNRSVISIFFFILFITFLLWPPGNAHAVDIKHKQTVQILPNSPIKFQIHMNLSNVLFNWVGTDLFVICGAAYGFSVDHNIIGKIVKPGVLSSGTYENIEFLVPVTQFISLPVGKKPAKAICIAFAKKGNTCTGLSGVKKIDNSITKYTIPGSLQSLNCDDITVPVP